MERSPLKYIKAVFWLVMVALCIAAPLVLSADGGGELTTADRVALLYAPQFNFTRGGEPLIHVGVFDEVTKAEFTSDGPLRVFSPGVPDPVLLLNGRKPVKVSIGAGKAGRYRYWVVVGRRGIDQSDATNAAIDAWADRGYLATPHEVGALFAVGGRRFDSRVVLIGLGGYDSYKEAARLAERIEDRFGVETEMHTELLDYPSGKLTVSGGGRRQKQTWPDVVWVAPEEPGQTFTIKTPKGKRRFSGQLFFIADQEGKLAVVNAVPIETLVKGVVPSEVYTSAPIESLKAQAVAARGHILGAVGVRHLGDPFLKCSEVHCQVYSGLSNEHPRTNRAVEETRGVVMFEASSLKGDWRIVDARYSSNCGGHTEDNDLVWGGEAAPYLRGRMDVGGGGSGNFAGGINERNISQWLTRDVQAWCNTDKYGGNRTFRWEKTVDIDTVQAKLNRIQDIGRLKDVAILARGVSGRIIRMRIDGEFGSVELDRELAIRRLFGGLRSSMFVMTVTRDDRGFPKRFDFKGGGFGHGSGMCQTGAMNMGLRKYNYRKILQHYYKGIALETLY